MITLQQLDGYLGKSISQICQNGYCNPNDNHSAHFVAHVLEYHRGMTCQIMGIGRAPGASLHVQDIFRKCRSTGVWSLRPAAVTTCLVFITAVPNVNLSAKTMRNAPRIHVGIFCGHMIWHYSNSQRKVVKQTPAQFATHYRAPDNAMFFGSMP